MPAPDAAPDAATPKTIPPVYAPSERVRLEVEILRPDAGPDAAHPDAPPSDPPAGPADGLKRLAGLVLWLSLALLGARTAAGQVCDFADVSFTTAGAHTFTVPSSQASYFVRLTVRGADGGNVTLSTNKGGAGATMVAAFQLLAGEVLDAYVGAPGETSNDGSGGGGGSAVILDDTYVLVAAGAGGGTTRFVVGGGGRANPNSIAAGGENDGDDGRRGGAGGGGFGFAGEDDLPYPDITGGGAGTLTGLGSGGLGLIGTDDGGAGWGGGGGSHGNNNGAGGGGGYRGGNGGLGTTASIGGDSFVNTATHSGTVHAATAGADGGGTERAGEVTIACVSSLIPPVDDPVVTTAIDEQDDSCIDGDCSLRDAVAAATAGSTITFAAGLSGSTSNLTIGQIALTKNLTIDVTSLAGGFTVDAAPGSRLFEVEAGATVTLRGLTLTGGQSDQGGAIKNAGTLTLERVTASGNTASDDGGALYNSGTLTLVNSTVSGNTAGDFGGGLFNTGTTRLVAATFSGNQGSMTFPNILATGHQVFIATGATLHLVSSVLAGAQAGLQCASSGTIATNRYVLVQDGSCNTVSGGTPTGFRSGNPLLGVLADNGGPTWTHLPQEGSPLVDAGTCDTDATIGSDLTADQRGEVRPVAQPHLPDAADGCDIGAVEAARYFVSTSVVTNANDDGVGSLRYVATGVAPGTTVTFAPALSGQTIALTSGQIVLSQNLTLDATALADGVTLDAAPGQRLFEVESGATVTLRGLTLTGGQSDQGGAIKNAGTLTLERVTVSGNTASDDGGALYNSGTITLVNTTVSANTAGGTGGGLHSTGTAHLVASTFSGNQGSISLIPLIGHQVYNTSGATLHLVSSVLAGALPGVQCLNSGTIATNRYVFVQDGTCNTVSGGTPTGFQSGNPMLGALADNSGPTLTHLPQEGSPLLDTGTCDTDAFTGADLTTDQRGQPRSVDGAATNASGDHCDIGAVEATLVELPVELASFTATADGEAVVLRWTTVSETNNAGFDVETRPAGAVDASAWQRLAFVEGHGTTSEAQRYSFRADGLEPGRHVFRLRQVDFDGAVEYSPEVEVSVELAGTYRLGAAYPNPFNPQTTFTLAVRRGQEVEVAVYDVLGRRVAVLYAGPMEGGQSRRLVWKAGGAASGLYFIRARGEDFAAVQRVTLLR